MKQVLFPARTLWDPAGKLRCLPDPTRDELLVELTVVLVDVEVAGVLRLGFAGREWAQ